jgi:hypothetical protein
LPALGEKIDQFEPFHPSRLAGRILGMGDIVGLVEKAAAAIDEEEARRMEEKLRTASFDLNDFLAQFKMIRKLGPLENILGMLPGMSNLKGFSVDENQMKRVEAIVLSMTLDERSNPDILNARRRQRIARGSGVSVTEVNDLLQRFGQMRKMMKNYGQNETIDVTLRRRPAFQNAALAPPHPHLKAKIPTWQSAFVSDGKEPPIDPTTKWSSPINAVRVTENSSRSSASTTRRKPAPTPASISAEPTTGSEGRSTERYRAQPDQEAAQEP